jgi:bifunctional UDP-N-acetylglucosamine pyrophosphorylase/glucosamine-1-phosphate N-acetyltransferase
MWPLQSKLLMRFGDEPLMQRQLRTYQSLGFEDVIIVANPANKAEIESITEPLEMQVRVVVQPEPIGMGDAILQAAEVMQNSDRAIYVNQVHDVVDESLHAAMLRMYRSNPQGSYMAGVEMNDYFPGGYLIVSEDGHISGIMEKPDPDKRPSNYVNIVAHIHSHAGRLFEAIQQQYDSGLESDDHYEQAMDTLMRDEPFYLVGYGGRWDYLKYPWHVLDMMDGFLSRIDGQTIADDAFVADTASLVGDVVIASGAKIFPGAAVVGPAYIGRNTILGNGALVRNSMVLDNCEVGYTTEVARSYVGSGCAMHACRVLDSVFADNVNFSAGCTTANLRMDKRPVKSSVKGRHMDTGRDKLGAIVGADAFLSVDVMTMPGVKVGAASQVGPGTHVHEDVPDNARLYVTQEQILRESSDR